jgi:hypothetical protein
MRVCWAAVVGWALSQVAVHDVHADSAVFGVVKAAGCRQADRDDLYAAGCVADLAAGYGCFTFGVRSQARAVDRSAGRVLAWEA